MVPRRSDAEVRRIVAGGTLLDHAQKIHGRAIRRAGELLREIHPQRGGDRKSTGRERPIDRSAAADEAGLSERQRKTALRVAAIPADDFEAAIESIPVPTVTQLAERAT